MGRSDAHDLMPVAVAKGIPALYTTEDTPDPLVHVKWFTPDSSWTWYVTEYDPAERLCFGLVIGVEREVGYFSVSDMEAARGPWGLRVERDLYFTKRRLSECR